METSYQILCLECGTLCGRYLDSDESRQEMVRSLWSLELEKNAKDQLEEQSNKYVWSKKSDKRKKHIER